ncbi:hypothetical protein LGQ03_05170 [Loktanella sp. TSTF-M6]|uniref:Uncharacterized protein n=1 Tax=Loktanella gaetbuli TaxID=2881335 RepID=A0ABS8BSD4_9RHOB|nr:hypothetical protein [Loktanella gaetbuli]MCB5198623.1 hypothetical protein [Loktanella gaetbuli]
MDYDAAQPCDMDLELVAHFLGLVTCANDNAPPQQPEARAAQGPHRSVGNGAALLRPQPHNTGPDV